MTYLDQTVSRAIDALTMDVGLSDDVALEAIDALTARHALAEVSWGHVQAARTKATRAAADTPSPRLSPETEQDLQYLYDVIDGLYARAPVGSTARLVVAGLTAALLFASGAGADQTREQRWASACRTGLAIADHTGADREAWAEWLVGR